MNSTVLNFALIRKSLKLTQEEFAELIGTSVSNIQNWEQGLSSPNGAVVTLYLLIKNYPEETREMLYQIRDQILTM